MIKYVLFIVLFFIVLNLSAQSEEDTQEMTVEQMNKKRQNPVEGMRSIFLQSVLIPDTGDGTAQSYSIQPVWPFKLGENLKLITYTIIPIQYLPKLDPAGDSAFGLGNILFNGFFSPIKKKGKVVYGGGPAIQIPTRTDPALGSSAVSMGPSGLIYFAGDKASGGVVAQNFWSLGATGANRVNLFSVQYMAYYNFEKGWFACSNSTIEADWLAPEGQKWLIPVGGGGGKTFQAGKSKRFYCGTAQLFYNAVKPDYLGNLEIIFQLQIIL